MLFDINGLSKEYLSVRLGQMLAEKDKKVPKYHETNEGERECFEALVETLTQEQAELFDAYQNAIVERQIYELYYAYIYGLYDGVNIHKLIAEP